MKPPIASILIALCFAAGAPLQAEQTPLLPTALQPDVIYYNDFEAGYTDPKITTLDDLAVNNQDLNKLSSGLVGLGLSVEGGHGLQLRSSSFSPDKPLTISFWWALSSDLPEDGCLTLCSLGNGEMGGGLVSAFVRGKGEWAALERPTGILQVWYFKDIENSTLFYDKDLAASIDLKAGVWHHTAIVFRQARIIELYTDGQKVADIQLQKSEFKKSHQLNQLTIGRIPSSAIWLDNVLILDRALDANTISRYFEEVSQIHRQQTK